MADSRWCWLSPTDCPLNRATSTRRVSRWRDAKMVKRWADAAFLATEKNFRKIMGYRDLWALDAILNGSKFAALPEAA